jgi:hypothetical protein
MGSTIVMSIGIALLICKVCYMFIGAFLLSRKYQRPYTKVLRKLDRAMER